MSINNTGVVRRLGIVIMNICPGDEDLNILREYIDINPAQWQLDEIIWRAELQRTGLEPAPTLPSNEVMSRLTGNPQYGRTNPCVTTVYRSTPQISNQTRKTPELTKKFVIDEVILVGVRWVHKGPGLQRAGLEPAPTG